ncbi:MAG: hypothetical protein PHQ67_03725 [Fermentimonas sp.]|jgi:hypothetical protein|nr:hypothetical protein [Fermentimonas sp.]MDD4008905.1 hypothetical protein [Fermentimonas sp.]MDD4697381.1 hypothetical protein [Fermentimonas sp.]
MGFLLKFFLFFVFIYLLLKGLVAFLVGGKRSGTSTNQYRQQRSRPEQPKQPETQEDRIIEYQKKSFESTEAEDADFVEIKDK